MTKAKIVPIFFACDDNYLPFLAVALKSLEDNASKNNIYEINILYTDIKEVNIKRIMDSYSHGNFQISFADVSEKLDRIGEKLHTRDYYSKTTYYRMFIPAMYPCYDKAIYLDGDIVINCDITKLYDFDLGENYVGAIPDEAVANVEQFRNYTAGRVGVHHSKYFNAGVLLMNLKALRGIKLEKLFQSLLNKVTFQVAQDQDYLNVICKDKVLYLDRGWDKMPLAPAYEGEELKIIHYNLSFKPWHTDGVNFEEYFWNYAQKTDFYDVIVDIKNGYSDEMKKKSEDETVNLMRLAQSQADDLQTNLEIAEKLSSCLKEFGIEF